MGQTSPSRFCDMAGKIGRRNLMFHQRHVDVVNAMVADLDL